MFAFCCVVVLGGKKRRDIIASRNVHKRRVIAVNSNLLKSEKGRVQISPQSKLSPTVAFSLQRLA
jgi:hypothetical protein